VATTQAKQSGTVVQAWLPHPLDQELRKHAEAEGRSLSSTIRLAIAAIRSSMSPPRSGTRASRPGLSTYLPASTCTSEVGLIASWRTAT
jgi:hypothetical protein